MERSEAFVIVSSFGDVDAVRSDGPNNGARHNEKECDKKNGPCLVEIYLTLLLTGEGTL